MKFALRLLACIVVGSFSTNLRADTYPSRPITLILGLSAGGAVDVISRMYADKLGQNIGQRVVVENRSGGGGIPAAVAVKQAAPDGYTLMVQLVAIHTILPAMQDVPYDPIKDFTPIAPLYSAPGYIVVPSSSPAKSVQELIAFGKSKPEGLTYGSPSTGSPAHVMGLLFQEATGVRMTHVPYRGGGQMMTDLLAGQLDLAFPTYTNFKGALEQGQVRSLAIAAPTRWSGTPDTPTLRELGINGVDVANLFGVAGPRGLPQAIVTRLHAELSKSARDPELAKRMDELGAVIIDETPEQLARIVAEDKARFEPILKKFSVPAKK